MNQIISDFTKCTGCSACLNICPVHAISFCPNQEGFLYPEISAEKCINCSRCVKVCPINNPPQRNDCEPVVFAAWHRDEKVREESSSGGAFSALAKSVLDKNGVVFGAAYDPFPHVKHIGIDSEQDLKKLRGSKYVQSDCTESFSRAKEFLENNRTVLYVGTPCQISGLKKYLNKEYSNLIACDLVCHGVPSPALFKKYLEICFDDVLADVLDFNFRSKLSGWYDGLRVLTLRGGKRIIAKNTKDFYFYCFNLNYSLRESCYQCQALGFPRASDITIADYWGIGRNEHFAHKKEIPQGISLVVLNNLKAKEVFQSASKFLHSEERNINEAVLHNRPAIITNTRPDKRSDFYPCFFNRGFNTFSNEYLRGRIKTRAIAFMREYFPKWLVVAIRNRITRAI